MDKQLQNKFAASRDDLVSQDEKERRRRQLIAEINEQIPFLAYGLSEKIHQNGLQGKVSVRGIMGEEWGIGVSKNNPRKDIPNIIIYPQRILEQERAVTNARLRHEIGNLNHHLGIHLQKLQDWCAKKELDFRLLQPLVESVQEASVNYLEIQNSFAGDPTAAFRPLYEQEVNVRALAKELGKGSLYKQAVDLTLLYALDLVQLLPAGVLETAEQQAAPQVRACFSSRIHAILEQAVKTSSGRIKIQLIRDYLWPRFSGLLPSELLPDTMETDTPPPSPAPEGRVSAAGGGNTAQALQNAIEEVKKQLQAKSGEREERQKSIDQLMEEMEKALADSENPTELEDLQSLLNPPKGEKEALPEYLQYQIQEIGVVEEELSEGQRELLERLREFCRKTTVRYVRTLRFLMDRYQLSNPRFTSDMQQRIMEQHLDTPFFTIYTPQTGQTFLEDFAKELQLDNTNLSGFLLNFNLPKLLGRFGYNSGQGILPERLAQGVINWEHLYISAMPILWLCFDNAVEQGLFFHDLNYRQAHNWRHYYYLYIVSDFPMDALNLPPDAAEQQQQGEEEKNEEEQEEHDAVSNQPSQDPTSHDNDGGSQGNENENGRGSESSQYGESDNSQQADSQSSVPAAAPDGNDTIPDRQTPPDSSRREAPQGALEELREQLTEDRREEILEQLLQRQKEMEAIAEQEETASIADSYQEENTTADAETEEEAARELAPEQNGQAPQNRTAGMSNRRALHQLFSQLEESHQRIRSQFEQENGQLLETQELDLPDRETPENQVGMSVKNLQAIKADQNRQMESFYNEQSGLNGVTLQRYIRYREDTKDLVHDLVEFFTDRFRLDEEFDYMQNQRHGSRLQKGWTHQLLGLKNREIVIEPSIFERRTMPKKTQFVWSVIIDNSASCAGQIIEEEKKAALALIEVAKELEIPLEIVVFGNSQNYTFLKTFDQELFGDQLAAVVQLNADQGTPDAVTLEAACSSVAEYAAQFNRSHNFIYFMTDGKSGAESIRPVIDRFRRDMVITGIGLAGAAQSIAQTWGVHAIGVAQVSKLSDMLIQKIESQINEIFD